MPRALTAFSVDSNEPIYLSFHSPKLPLNSLKEHHELVQLSEIIDYKPLKNELLKSYQTQLYSFISASPKANGHAKENSPTNETRPKKAEEQNNIWNPSWKRVEVKQEMQIRDIINSVGEINNNELIKHYGFSAPRVEKTNWSAQFQNANVAATLAKLERQEKERQLIAKNRQEGLELRAAAVEDHVKQTQSQALTKVDSEQVQAKDNPEMDDETWDQELVMIDYTEAEENKNQNAGQKVVPEINTEITESNLSTTAALSLLASSNSGDSVSDLNTQNAESELDTQKIKPAGPQAGQAVRVNSMSDDLIDTQQISDSVMNAIAREMGKSPSDSKAESRAVTTQKIDYSRLVQSGGQKKKAPQAEYSSFKNNGYSQNRLTISSANIEADDSGKQLRNFEFFAETLNMERYLDDSTGSVELNFELASAMSVIRGTVMKRGYMRTKVDVIMEPGSFELDIPLIEQSTFGRFLDAENINGYGGYVLVKLPQEASTVDLDSRYEAKIHLNDLFKVVEADDNFKYILFAGVKPGNVLISFENYQSKVADKISHVVEDEVLYEDGVIIESSEIYFDLLNKKILAQKDTHLDIDAGTMNYFNREQKAYQQAVGTYSIQTPLRALGMRDYIELRHTSLPMFAGTWGKTKITLPSEDFAYYIMDSHALNNLDNSCLVQVNLSKPIRKADFYGETKSGPMGVIQSFLDKDGSFSYEASEMATHVFLVGDLQGLITGKIEYLDGQVDFLQTFCSNNTYLVEQL